MKNVRWRMASLVILALSLGTLTGCGGNPDKIVVVGRQNSSGTYGYFLEEVVGKDAHFRQGISAQSGSKEVVELISKTPGAIGYSGMGYTSDQVKMLHVSKKKGETAVEPTIEMARAGKYPLSRPLYIYTAGDVNDTAKHYIAWIKSAEGQKILADEGYVPLTDAETGPAPTGNPPDGEIKVEGSDTMIQVAGKWAQVYMKNHPNVKIVVGGGGSGKGITSLIDGHTDLCNASREMKPKERADLKEKRGKETVENKVGMDALAIYVHKDNKLVDISMEELKEIYGEEGKITLWSQLGSEKKAE
jgi:ABC-type phosphate transport system substrate-binding protein